MTKKGFSCFQWQSLLAGLLNFLSERVPEPKLQSQLGLWVGWCSKLNWKWQSVVSRYYGQESFPADARRYVSNKRRAALFLYLKHCSIPRNVNNLSNQPQYFAVLHLKISTNEYHNFSHNCLLRPHS